MEEQPLNYKDANRKVERKTSNVSRQKQAKISWLKEETRLRKGKSSAKRKKQKEKKDTTKSENGKGKNTVGMERKKYVQLKETKRKDKISNLS